MSAYCSKCGAQIPDGAGFCVSCGAQTNSGTGQVSELQEVQLRNAKSKQFLYMILGCIMAFIGFTIAAGPVIGGITTLVLFVIAISVLLSKEAQKHK